MKNALKKIVEAMNGSKYSSIFATDLKEYSSLDENALNTSVVKNVLIGCVISALEEKETEFNVLELFSKFVLSYGDVNQYIATIKALGSKGLVRTIDEVFSQRILSDKDVSMGLQIFVWTQGKKIFDLICEHGTDKEVKEGYEKAHADAEDSFIDELIKRKATNYLEEIYDSLIKSQSDSSEFNAKTIKLASFIAGECDAISIALSLGKTPRFAEEKIILAKGLVKKGEDGEIIEATHDIDRDDSETFEVFIEAIKSKTSRVDLLLNWYLNLLT